MSVRILILWAVEVLAHPEAKIGEPTNIEKDMAASANAANAEEDTEMAVDPPAPKLKALPTPAPRPAPGVSSNQQRGEKAPPIFPIEGLSPYQNKYVRLQCLPPYSQCLRWTIKARVTQKSEKKRWSNSKGDGQLFSVNLMDETCEIKATAFNAAVDVLYDKFEEGKVSLVIQEMERGHKSFRFTSCQEEK